MKREWNIRVGRKATIVADFRVPMNKLDGKRVHEFLRALVIRYTTNSLEDMLHYYVNARRGKPVRRSDLDTKSYIDYEKCLNGFCCGDWDCYASAAFQLTSDEAEALHNIRRQNKRAS